MVDVATALSLVKPSEMQRALRGGMRHGHSKPLNKVAGDFTFPAGPYLHVNTKRSHKFRFIGQRGRGLLCL